MCLTVLACEVMKVGTCSHNEWIVSFTQENPGDVSKLLSVNAQNVIGNNISAYTYEFRKGGLMFMPLSSQMLHTQGT